MNYPIIYTALSRARFNLASEKDVQTQIAGVLLLNLPDHVKFTREYELDKTSRIDFLVNNTVGIEVKIKGTKKSIYKQLLRYAQFDTITELILVTSKSMGLPATLNNKPLYVINISKAWL